MINLTFSADARNSEVAPTFTLVSTAAHDRAWWAEEASRASTDWPSVVAAALELLVASGILEPEPDTDTMPPWDAPSWRQAAKDYQEQHAGHSSTETIERERLSRLRRLLESGVTLDRAWDEINRSWPAPKATVDALLLSLRRGADELVKTETFRQLSVLDEGQIEDVCLRVQAFQPGIAPAWSADDADLLISAWRKFREQR
jgi:hypothetical protein